MTARSALRRARGIVRSLAMYHAIPGRHPRMARFYGAFLGPGDVAFDVGAHVGSRVRAWRRLGTHVVAVEPQPDCLRVLRLLFGRSRDVTIVPSAVGARPGRARLGVSSATPTVSSLSPGWRDVVASDPGFAGVRWDHGVDVPVTTLDELVAEHGVPAFCKIDVEGSEADVLAGLTRALPALSFEYLPAAHDETRAVLDRVEQLGRPEGGYRYNYSRVETMHWECDEWLDAAGLAALLERLRPLGRSGDVYARLPGRCTSSPAGSA